MKIVASKLTLLMAVALMIILTGCSQDSPLQPTTENNAVSGNLYLVAVGDPVQFDARVMSTDPATRMLTFYNTSDIVFAAEDCEIFTMVAGVEVPLTFSDIQVDDSVRVCGTLQDDNSVLANRIHLYEDCEPDPCDVSFRDTIISIDYAGGTFMVAGRTETIQIDENTLIWGNILTRLPGGLDALGYVADDGQALAKVRPDNGYHTGANDTILAFSDLHIGDVVDVGADIIDANTLLARSIKLVNCEAQISVEFIADLVTLDCDNRLVTFDAQDWIGQVCPGAELFDALGNPIALCDFSIGDNVVVKGRPIEENILYISSMTMTGQ